MSSSTSHSSSMPVQQFVQVDTNALKERLSILYDRNRGKAQRASVLQSNSALEHIWDLKELALIEKWPSVEVPKILFDEMEKVLHASEEPTASSK